MIHDIPLNLNWKMKNCYSIYIITGKLETTVTLKKMAMS